MPGTACADFPRCSIGKKPWIDVDGASPEAIAAQVGKCPSGALSYELLKKAK